MLNFDMDGIFNINKPTGMTSHDVVAAMRKLLKQRRVGHAGTLDPAASGVLPICVGQGTRVAEYLSASGKAYQAEIVFGIVTDTYDTEGTVTRTASATNLTLAHIEATLPSFLGPQMQLPPRYSAIKIQGQPAYKRVRSGEDVQLEARPIVIEGLDVLAWEMPRLTIAIECSKGTYIRSLAFDLGERLGCGAYLAALMRTRSGPFSIAESVTLEQLAVAQEHGTLQSSLYAPDMVLYHYPALTIDDATVERVLHGNPFVSPLDKPTATRQPRPGDDEGSRIRVYDASGRFLAIAEWDAERARWQPKKVFEGE